jgi:hypothetical protein
MKRWLVLFVLLITATIVAVVISLPSERERRHATIRPGMTVDEVHSIMHDGLDPPEYRWTMMRPIAGEHWSWTSPRRLGRPEVELVVWFGDDLRVSKMAVRRK